MRWCSVIGATVPCVEYTSCDCNAKLGYKFGKLGDLKGETYLVYAVGPLTPICVVEQMDQDIMGAELIGSVRDDRYVTIEVWRK